MEEQVAEFDLDAFKERFRTRADAVRERGVPPLEGEARRSFIEAAEQDFIDFSLIADADVAVEDDSLVLRVPLESS
jgi:hypothetical protein